MPATNHAVHTAKELCTQGYGYAPINPHIVSRASRAFRHFTERRDFLKDWNDWGLCRKGEDPEELDRGLSQRKGDGTSADNKFVTHYDPLLSSDFVKTGKILTSTEYEFFDAMQILYDVLTANVTDILIECDKILKTDMASLYQLTINENQIPYATTALRCLGYPPVENQKGATGHDDRGCLATHLGDEGGWLLGALQNSPGKMVKISPKQGQVLLFWGVKILWASQGRLNPLWHSSRTKPEEYRSAMVGFHHIPIEGYEVRNAKVAKAHYWAEVHQKYTAA